MLKNYRELIVWQRSYDAALQVYKVTSEFPKSEIYGLTSQLRRGAVSIPSNLAEGHTRGQTLDYIRFIGIARGSLAELQTQLMLARDLSYLDTSVYAPLADEYEQIERMLAALLRSLAEKQAETA